MIFDWPNVLPSNSNFRLASNSKIFRSPLSGAVQTEVRGGSVYAINADFRNLVEPNTGLVSSVLARQDGQANRIRVPNWGHTQQGTEGGGGLVNGASQTGFNLISDGWTASTHIFKPGDYIAVEDRFYMITQNAVSDSGGNCTLQITPRLRVSPTNNAIIFYQHGSSYGENVTNGGFLTNTTGWTANSSTIAWYGGKLRSTYSSSSAGGLRSTSALSITNTRPYRLRMELLTMSASFTVRLAVSTDTTKGNVYAYTDVTATGIVEVEFVSTSATPYIHIYTSGLASSNYFEFTGVSLLKGMHYPAAKMMLMATDIGWATRPPNFTDFALSAVEDIL